MTRFAIRNCGLYLVETREKEDALINIAFEATNNGNITMSRVPGGLIATTYMVHYLFDGPH